MLTITKDSLLTVEDFIKNKEHKPFSDWRTTAKTENFMLLFAASAASFAVKLENSGFTEKDCESYLRLVNQEQFYKSMLANSKGKSQKDIKFLAVATLMRNAFLEGYKGLWERIVREQTFAYEHGYVRAYHGPVRHLPELRFMKRNADNALTGADRWLYSGQFSHIINQACNSTIQTMEARIAFATWHNINYYIKKWGLKSYTINNVHDSLEAYVYKPELEIMCSLFDACSKWEREPVEGIHMSMDIEISDVTDLSHRENTYYKHGAKVKAIPIEQAVENYNKKHGTNLKWEGCLS